MSCWWMTAMASLKRSPGFTTPSFESTLRRVDWWYAHGPGVEGFCSIGGNVNTNAGGLCCVKYGVTRDAVLGLEVVLADGRITRLGRKTIKGVAGYDLTGLMVGSEGTLGIVTMARLRLGPIPAPPTTVVGVFSDVAEAGRAVSTIMNRLRPSMLELMDNASISAVEAWQPMGLDTSAGALLIGQFDSPGSASDAKVLSEICEQSGAQETYVSEDPQEAEMLVWALRRMVIPALESAGDWLLDDVAVPRTQLARTMVQIQEVAERHDVQIATFGHAGDGNLHPTIVTPRGDDEAAARALTAFDEILDVALANGGTVTGEHGIGSLKREALAKEIDEIQMDLHSRIKEALDPRNILNPGKALARW